MSNANEIKISKGTIAMLFYVSKLLYPNLPYYCFPFYMVIEYYKMRQRNLVHFLKVAPIEAFVNILQEKHQLEQEDYNNTLATGATICNTGDFAELTVTFKNRTNKRKVKILKIGDITGNCLISSELLLFNLGQSSLNEDTNMQAKLKFISKSDITVADEIEVSLISSSNDISNSIIDCLIKEYFRKPKLIRMNDVFVINIRIFGAEIFYTKPMESNNVENLYFKCSKVVCKDKVYNETCFCILNDTTIKQNANIQSFVPKDNLIVPRRICSNETLLCGLPLVPYGFTEIFNTLKKSVEPFLVNTKLDLHPSFLMTGKKGSGKELLVEALSKTFGMHYYKVTNHDLTANVYAQNETKLRNAFFNAKIASPCILCITNFENFGKNNEGQFDERIMNHFIQELDGLFSNNRYPVVLFCLNNERAIPGMLKRSFLETFELRAPHESDRESILKWLLAKFNLIASFDLKEIANKTNGFLFEDLNALVYHAKSEYLKEGVKDSKDTDCSICLNKRHFSKALDLMQSTYHESLGAPKVPKVLWSDIGGLTEVKQEIINTINLPLRCPELLKSTGLGRSGILLFGPPGTGKTLIAKAVATECNLCFLSVKGPELLNMYVGQSEENVREVFERAREASPCIIFFDELDSLAPNRGLSGDSGGVMDRVVSQLLAEMDGVNNEGNIFIIGATNRPDLIDPALLRPGRFDKLLYVGPCTDKESKKSVLEALTRKFVLAKDVNLEKIVNSCPTNITGADFYGICANAWTSAVQRVIDRFEKGVKPSEVSLNSDIVTVNIEDFENAIRSVKPSVSRKDILYFEKLKKELT